MDASVCVACGELAVILDTLSGVVVCEACGRIKDDGPTLVSGKDAQFNSGSGWQSSVNSSGLQGMQTYDPVHWTDKKKRLAMQSVEHVTSCLRLPPDKVEEVKHLLGLFFETGYGVGRWVELSVGACAYIVIRQTNTPLTLLEVAEVVNCSLAELGRTFNRVVSSLQITLPETDPSIFLERAVMKISAFQTLTRPVKRDLVKHGLLLLEYARHWSITTGRHFLPVIAAILLLLGEANQLKMAAVQISRELHTSQACTCLRSKELKDALVGFLQRLPWGPDITVKTLHRHMSTPFLLQYLDFNMKLMKKGAERAARSESSLLPPGNVADITQKQDKKRGPDSDPGTSQDDGKKRQRTEASDAPGKQAVWAGLPPAFVASEEARCRRCKRIALAKARILETKKALLCDVVNKPARLKRKEVIDDEDLLIEYLILRGANEEGIKDGYYRTLLSVARTEDDNLFSDQDLARYFRSKGEIARLRSMSQPELPH